MIVTLTTNPSIDATLRLDQALAPGEVNRAVEVTRIPGGKGVNVTRAIHLAGRETVALFPSSDSDPFMDMARVSGFPFINTHMDSPVRTNTTLTEPGGRTTKANGPGPILSDRAQQTLLDKLAELSMTASWVVLAGSLPGGVPDDWYATLTRTVHEANPQARVAVDTSDKYLRALREKMVGNMPNLIKPNGMELGQFVSQDGLELERLAQNADYRAVLRAARKVNDWGIHEVLVTLGSAGAVLVTRFGSWVAMQPPTEVQSTVGAGDSAMAGFLMARTQGKDYPEALRFAVAYGTAAARLPGTVLPTPDQIDVDSPTVITL